MISVTILVKNGQKYLHKVLSALERFEEVIVVDTGSEDDSKAIAKSFKNVQLHEKPFIGFGPTHNVASSLAKHEWILSIDADEVASKELVDEIFALQLDENTVYRLPRKNFFRGKWINGCGWHPDAPLRLYNRSKTKFTDALVHESIETKGLFVCTLKAYLNHYPYATMSDFIAKMQSYSTLFAEQNRGKKKSSLTKAISHALFAFFKSYIVKRGILLGQEGFIISLYNSHTAYYKYLKLQEYNNLLKIDLNSDLKV